MPKKLPFTKDDYLRALNMKLSPQRAPGPGIDRQAVLQRVMTKVKARKA